MAHPGTVKARAVALRRRGRSYGEIADALSLPESTVATWVKAIKLTAQQTARLVKKGERARREGSRVIVATAQRRRDAWVAEGVARAANDPEFRVIGALYWGEGGKGRNTFAITNSDPAFHRVVLGWLKKEGLFAEARLRVLYRDGDGLTPDEVKTWWTTQLQFPASQCREPAPLKKKRTVWTSGRWTYGVATILVFSTRLRQLFEGCIEALKKTYDKSA